MSERLTAAPAALIFDFDGVLVESVDVKSRAFAMLFRDEQREQINRIVTYHLEHGGVPRGDKIRHIYAEILKRPLDSASFAELCLRFAELVVEDVIRCPPVVGAAECLASAAASGIPMYIVSATPESELREIVALRRLSRWFSGVFGSPASKVDNLRRVLAIEQADPDDVVFIGDAYQDYTAAATLRIPFIARVIDPDMDPFPADVRRIGSLADIRQHLSIEQRVHRS